MAPLNVAELTARFPAALVLGICLLAASSVLGNAQEGPPGLTVPVVLPPFNAEAAACLAPPGLRKTLAFAQDNERQFMQGVARGLTADGVLLTDQSLHFRAPRFVAMRDSLKDGAGARNCRLSWVSSTTLA